MSLRFGMVPLDIGAKGVERKPGEEVMVARASAFVVGAVAITIAILVGPSLMAVAPPTVTERPVT